METADASRKVRGISREFSIVRFVGCASAVGWFAFKQFYSEDQDHDRKQVANIGACIVFLEFLQDNRKPRPLGRLVNIFKIFIYVWWLYVALSLCQRMWSTIGESDDSKERAIFAVNALNFLILVKIWSQIEHIHQAFADVFSRFNLKAGTYFSVILSILGLFLSSKNFCDSRVSWIAQLPCNSSQTKSAVLLFFSIALLAYYRILHRNYKKTGKGYLPKGALVNPEPTIIQPGDMVPSTTPSTACWLDFTSFSSHYSR
jgi:divalent metal cation (Fe/Co/Zn/Cd) transporter